MTKYYASYNTAVSPAPVAAWYDTDQSYWIDFSVSGFLEITKDQYNNRNAGLWAVSNNSLVPYTPPDVVLTIQTQAVMARAWIQQQANLAAAMGEVFTVDMKTYVKTINAIANGTDTVSTTLPTQPTDVMAAA